jgi:hypothetical protein
MTKFKCKCFSWSWFKVSPLTAPEQPIEPTADLTKVKVTTAIHTEQVLVLNFTPEKVDRRKFPYNCPICMRFLSHILVTECCSNYVCHSCSDDIETNQMLQPRCPHCAAEQLKLHDVEPSAQVRTYFDSPLPKLDLEQMEVVKEETSSQSQILLSSSCV